MTALPRQLAKEYRALLPGIAVAAAAVVISKLPIGSVGELGVPLFVIAAMAIGSLAIGHEYTARTLPLLLVQPCRRERLLLVKFFAAASVIVPMASFLHFSQGRLDPLIRTMIDMTVLLSLTVAPWITMATRNPIAGVVFTLAVPGLLLLAGGASSAHPGAALDVALLRDGFGLAVVRAGSLTLGAVGLWLTWRTFIRLEVVDETRSSYVRLPVVLRERSRPLRRSRVWLLVGKELHLQQLTFTVPALYLAVRVSVALLVTPNEDVNSIIIVLSALYAVMIAGVAGATVSAEERHLGTHEWQLLMPMPAWQQWALKVAVALGLALLLGIALPAGLSAVLPGPAVRQLVHPVAAAALVVAFTVGTIYLSSISSSAVWALLGAGPAALGVVLFVNVVAAISAANPGRTSRLGLSVDIALLLADLVFMLWVALANHRRADRSWRRTAVQVCAAAAALIALSAALSAFPPL